MTHDVSVATFDLLNAYFVDPVRKSVARFRIQRRNVSHKIRRATRSGTDQARSEDMQEDMQFVSSADFSDSKSERVLDAIADALIEPLARQAARADFAEWLATQKGHR
jgi:hypothetical protein